MALDMKQSWFFSGMALESLLDGIVCKKVTDPSEHFLQKFLYFSARQPGKGGYRVRLKGNANSPKRPLLT